MKYSILDTDVLSEFLRGNVKVVSKVVEHTEKYGFISISVITYYEILNGLLYKDAKKQLARFEEFVKLNNVLPLTLKRAAKAAAVEADLRRKGTVIGHTDTLIAGTALSEEWQLITNNTAHFKRIEGLTLANWTK